MTSETEQQEAGTGREQRPEGQDALHRFGSVFRQQLDLAIEPIVANIRQHAGASLQQSTNEAAASRDAASNSGESSSAGPGSLQGQADPQLFSISADPSQAEHALQSVLDSFLDAQFSDKLQSNVRKRSEQMVHSLVSAGRELAAHAQSLEVDERRFDEMLDGLLADLFSDSARKKAHHQGEQIIQELLTLDVPAARRSGEKALVVLADQRLAAFEQFWRQVLEAVVKAGKKGSDTAGQARQEPSKEDDIPQTIARSDKRAQQIWTKARDQAAKQGDEGASAERAAYVALKERYEKKGDRWVKKDGEQPNGGRASSDRKAAGTSRRARDQAKR